MAMYVSLESAPPRCCSLERKSFCSAIPFFGFFFEFYREKKLTDAEFATISPAKKIEVIQLKNGNRLCGAVNDVVCGTGSFLMAGFHVSPVISYISGAFSVFSLIVIRPLLMWRNYRQISLLRGGLANG